MLISGESGWRVSICIYTYIRIYAYIYIVCMHYSYRFSINLNSFQNKKLPPQLSPKRRSEEQVDHQGGALSAPYRSMTRPERGFKGMKSDPFLSPLKPWDATDGQLLSCRIPSQVLALCPLPSCIKSQPSWLRELGLLTLSKPPVFSPGKWKARKAVWEKNGMHRT